MSEFNISIPGGESKRLLTGDKYCPDDILVTAEGTGQGYDEGYADGVEQGKKAERDYFWENYKSDNTNWQYAFGNRAWNDTAFNPTKDIVVPQRSDVSFMFHSCRIYNLKQILQRNGVKLDLSGATSNFNFARNSMVQYFPHIDFSRCDVLNNCFAGCTMMIELSLSVKEKVQCNNVFQNCRELIDLTIVSGTFGTSLSLANSPLLSDASIQSVIDALADLTGATAQTLTLHNDTGNKLTEEQKSTITAKNWTLVY